jgi:hypothetical protein
MAAVMNTPILVSLLGLMPQRLHEVLNAWSRRVAQRRLETRRHRGDRPTPQLPPVVMGHAVPPNPWRG